MEKSQEKPHKFDIGEGYGIWTDLDGITHRSFPDVFYRAKPGDSAGAYKIGDLAIMNQPTTKKRFGMFVIANVESGDFGGTGLKYKLTVHPYGTPEEISGLKPAAPIQQADNSKEKESKMNTASGGRCRFTDEDGFCTNENMQGGGFRCFGAGCECREPIRGPKPAAPIQQADNSKKKEPKMKRPTYKMQKIKLADCKPHADAEAYSASTEDRAALGNSIEETGVLSPIAVVPDEDSKRTTASSDAEPQKWFVIDGIGRMNALIAAGETETEAQVFDLGDLSVAEFVVCKNAMMRKVTTGTRVMAYLKCHEREVLAAADPAHYSLRGRDAKGRIAKPAVSHETAGDKGWSAKDIAGRIGVSKQDVLAGIELLKEVSGENGGSPGTARPTYEQMDLFETMDSVMHGETPIRRWKAAACGKVSKVGGKAAADYEVIGFRTMKSLAGVWENWQTIPMDSRGLILEE
ncbi:MAG: ParB-like nuclease domain-containing protein, partial [Kiritimatiellae bacterium]|nr:ParB-like nuclease domain-containing protein [Kiritimatiellia bacterium]